MCISHIFYIRDEFIRQITVIKRVAVFVHLPGAYVDLIDVHRSRLKYICPFLKPHSVRPLKTVIHKIYLGSSFAVSFTVECIRVCFVMC